MGLDSRHYRGGNDEGGKGRFGHVLRRIFGDGENPLSWSIPLYRAWGIQVRVHLVYILVIVGYLIWSLDASHSGFMYMLLGMGTLFILVLLHEYGHCIACRLVGGSADQILMWPLGGLAYCRPPHNWRANLITTIGGPGVNLVLLPILGGAVWALAGRDAALFNPFDPYASLNTLSYASGRTDYFLIGLWWAHYMNAVLLAFNVLLPMFPMDGGRMLQEFLWRSMGYHRATSIAATVGLVLAVAVFVFATVGGSTTLLSIALFAGLTCWLQKRQLQLTGADQPPGMAGYDFSGGYSSLPDDDADDPVTRRKAAESEQERLDAILAKIAAKGMASLSWRERRWLKRTTEKRRRG